VNDLSYNNYPINLIRIEDVSCQFEKDVADVADVADIADVAKV
jgi:hypothetical protein